MTDLSKFFLAENGSVKITLPNDEPFMVDGVQVEVVVCSPSSKKFINAKAELDRIAFAKLTGAMKGKGKQGGATDAEADAKFLAAITVEIKGLTGNEPIDLYSEPKLIYINDQVRNFAFDQANFFKG